ncbi:MAG: TM0996/MTH895 family glutaredoxin-like protein [Deltaproteobacteria bacterium]|nr:TM0996/MTH895 family glutaredoxin-like protein [Deltaproteobacteria bacterium]
MKNVKVLGTGCPKCKATLRMVEEVARQKGVEIELVKVEDLREIMTYGIVATPGVVIDGKVVHAGGVPARDKVASWL